MIVVGAGPAGALAALLLARAGARTLLVDRARFPRAKVCGGCLNASALQLLKRVGLGELPERLGAVPLHQARLRVRGSETWLALPGGAALSRGRLDSALAEEAERAGATLRLGWAARRTEPSCDAGTLSLELVHETQQHEQHTTRLLLAADGLGGRTLGADTVTIAKHARLGAGLVLDEAPRGLAPGEIHLAFGRGGYVGFTCVEGGRATVAAALSPAAVKLAGGARQAALAVLAESAGSRLTNTLGEQLRDDDSPWQGTGLLTQRPASAAAQRTFALGDAAGYVEPVTGEGIAWALQAAIAVTPLALHGCEQWDDSLVRRWAGVCREFARQRQKGCRLAARLTRSPRLLSGLLGVSRRWPSLSQPLLGLLRQPGSWQAGSLSAGAP
ncbi:MAG: NAD(P)/FAD-dependent oxidoreductase [Planctomycetota bacterium]